MQSGKTRFLEEALHIFALCNFGIAYPVLEIVSRNPEFLIVRHVETVDVVLLAFVLCFLIPALLVLFEVAAGAASLVLQQRLHAIFVILLVALTILPGLKRILPVGGPLTILGSVFLGTGIHEGIKRFYKVRWFFNFLSPAVIVVPALFFLKPSVHRFLTVEESRLPHVHVNSKIPVVLLVLDELPVISLMDGRQNIDEVRYPNFARLARDTIWFRDATTVADATPYAIGAIGTGIYPREGLLPTAEDYPRNLFTFLGDSYKMEVFEPVTRLCPKTYQPKIDTGSPPTRLKWMLTDLAVVYFHMILPYDLSFRLPSVTQTWQNFWGNPESRATPFGNPHSIFNSFLQSISPHAGSRLYYLHLDLPHLPWRYLPSGKEYDFFRFGYMGVEGLNRFEIWENDEQMILKGYQRHLLQLAFVDKLIGELIDRLNETGLYDTGITIVTADHGLSFRAGSARRQLNHSNHAEIMGVPLFFKSPHQTGGFISDRAVETVDIFPSIADALQTSIPWHVDGKSFLVSNFHQRKDRIFYSKKVIRQKYDLDARSAALQKKLELFGEHTGNERLFRIGPHARWIGKPVPAANDPKGSGLRVILDKPESYERVVADARFVPSYVTGRVVLEDEEAGGIVLGIAVNGIVKAVTGIHKLPDGSRVFSCLVPEDSFHPGSNKVEVVPLEGN